MLSLCVALPSCSTAPFISLQMFVLSIRSKLRGSVVISEELCTVSVKLSPSETGSGQVPYIPVCTGPESAFLMRTRRCALTAAFQADANVNSFQQMPPGKASMNVTKLQLEYTSDEKCPTSQGSENTSRT